MSRSKAVSLWAPVVVCMAIIFVASAQPDPGLPDQISDKAGHGIAYGGLALTATRAFAGGLPASITLGMAARAWLLSVVYGVSDEVHQAFVPGRTPDTADVFADAIGAGLSIVGCWAWGILSSRSR